MTRSLRIDTLTDCCSVSISMAKSQLGWPLYGQLARGREILAPVRQLSDHEIDFTLDAL